MRIMIESTAMFTKVDGVLGRVWRGRTGSGVHCEMVIPMIRVGVEQDLSQFDAELKELPTPEDSKIVNMRQIW